MGELQWVRGMLFTTIQTCYSNFEGSEGPKMKAVIWKPAQGGGGKMLKSIESSVWCVGWTWFDVRCTPLILGNVLQTHNMYCRTVENFLEASEVQKIMKNSIFYNIFGTYKLPLEWVSNYKNHYPFAFSSKNLFSCILSVQKCFQLILVIKEIMLHIHIMT